MKINWSKLFPKLLNVHVLTSIVLFGLMLIYGYQLRAVHPEYYPIGFDQIQILQNAKLIDQGHFVLLGPRTGPAPMFTGPLVYYIAAAAQKFTPAPYALVNTALTIYVVTFIALAILVDRYVDDHPLGWLIAALYAFSPYQIFLDRTPWNPDITFLAAALVFFPLLYKKGKKLGVIEILSVMSGCFLGYQAHFSGLLLPAYAGLAWLVWYRKQWWLPLLSGLALAASLVPTALFDYRHGFPNLHGFLFLLQQRGVAQGPPTTWYQRFFTDGLVVFENAGKITAFTAPYYILISLGFLAVFLFLWNYKQQHTNFWWPLIWILALNIVFIFYQGQKPEYYFLLQFPALFYVICQAIRPLFKGPFYALCGVLAFSLYSFYSTTYQLQKAPSLDLGNQIAATQKVREYQKESNSIVVYDMSDLDAQGMRYLLADLPSGSATTSAQTTHLVYPYSQNSPVSNVYGELAVWQDPRTDPQKNYLVRKQAIIASPTNVDLLENHYHQNIVEAADSEYIIENNNVEVAKMFFLDDKQSNAVYNTFMEGFMPQFDRAQKKWQQVKLNGQVGFVQPATNVTIIVLFTDPKMNSGDQINFLDSLQVISYDQ